MSQKISLGKHPYTYARVSVMKGNLLKKEDYQRLLKVSLNEIISFLESSEYKKEIDEFAVNYSGVELMEMALNSNLVRTWNKLKKISSEDVNLLIESYLGLTDLWNLKTILRGLYTGLSIQEFAPMIMPAGKLSADELSALMKAPSVEDLVKIVPGATGIKAEKFSSAVETFKKENRVAEIENVLDREYYKELLEFAELIPSKGKLFKQILESEIENRNLMTILRLKKTSIDKTKLSSFVIGNPNSQVKRLIHANAEETAVVLAEMKISEEAISRFNKENTLLEIEIELGKNLLKKTSLLIHQHPLTVDVILGYMFSKEIEVKNLKMLLKARQLNLSEDFIEKQIII